MVCNGYFESIKYLIETLKVNINTKLKTRKENKPCCKFCIYI